MHASSITRWTAGSNHLTARWAVSLGARSTDGFVVSGAGVWPLLALLASGATGEGLHELTESIGLDIADPAGSAIEMIESMRSSAAASAAIGVWASERVGLLADWAARLPVGTVQSLSGDGPADQSALDHWAAEQTHGLIDSCPVTVTPATMVVLMSALLVQISWSHAFTDGSLTWSCDRRSAESSHPVRGLSRISGEVESASVIDHDGAAFGRVVCVGTEDIDVHLISGAPEDTAGLVLSAGIAAVTGPHLIVPAADLPVGSVAGCLEVIEVIETTPGDDAEDVAVALPRFDLAATHDLLQLADVFGLRTVSAGGAHFPGMASESLAVDAAVQQIRASFSREGFVAAAVTAVAMLRGMALPGEPRQHRRISVVHDRPFGFLAVQRSTGLVLVAGWVTDPGDPDPGAA